MRIDRRFAMVAFCSALFGCNEIVGIHEPIAGDAGAAPSSPGPSSGDPFVGTWTARAGVQHIDCGSLGSKDQPSSAFDFVVGRDGSNYTLVQDVCSYPSSVSGAVLSIASGARCSGVDSDTGRPAEIVIGNGTLKLGDVANTAELTLEGTVTTVDNSGNSLKCAFGEVLPCDRKP